jgi:hypothetical protein
MWVISTLAPRMVLMDLQALKYLLAHPKPTTVVFQNRNENGMAPIDMSPMSCSAEFMGDDHHHLVDLSPQSQGSDRSSHNSTFSTTPRGKRSHSQLSIRGSSIGKRSGMLAAEYLQWAAPESPYSPTKSFEQVASGKAQDEKLEFEVHGESQSDDGFEGLDNMHACCDGWHTVGPSGHQHYTHYHAHSHLEHLDV